MSIVRAAAIHITSRALAHQSPAFCGALSDLNHSAIFHSPTVALPPRRYFVANGVGIVIVPSFGKNRAYAAIPSSGDLYAIA